MEILIGTTNPSNVERFKALLSGYDITFYTLQDLQIRTEPEEMGNTPEENAILKAMFYGKYFDRVICNDSGLYFDELPLNDRRQPGLHIRTPGGIRRRLNDEEMIAYYMDLIHSLGGKVRAYYLDGIAVYHRGKIESFLSSSDDVKESSFYMVDHPSPKRQPGWPLDLLSLDRQTLHYFVDDVDEELCGDSVVAGEYRRRLVDFLKKTLAL